MIEEITIYNEELESMNKEINKPEVAEEKKENEKQEKTVVELESPKEKSKLDINEIDLAGIKILNGTKIFEVEAGYNQYLQKTLYSTFQVVLPLSNYEAHLRGLTLDEIDALKNSFADQFTVKPKLTKNILSSSLSILNLKRLFDTK
jgi:acetate kinase